MPPAGSYAHAGAKPFIPGCSTSRMQLRVPQLNECRTRAPGTVVMPGPRSALADTLSAQFTSFVVLVVDLLVRAGHLQAASVSAGA